MSMWAVALASSQPWRNSTVAPTKPPQMHLSLVVLAHSRQPSLTLSSNNNKKVNEGKQPNPQLAGGMGGALLAAVKSNSSSEAKPRKQQSSQSPESQGDQRPPLSGSDVLWALQKANAEKAKKKKKDLSSTSKARRLREGRSSGEQLSAVDYTGVRPVCLKSEWSARLEELERRLGELMDEAA